MIPELSTSFQSSLTTCSIKNLTRISPPSINSSPPTLKILSKTFTNQSSASGHKLPTQMASEPEVPDQSQPSLAETLRNSSGGGIPLVLPFILGVVAANLPDRHSETREPVVLIDALTQSVLVVNSSGGSDASFDDLFPPKDGRRPASKASIDALPSVEVASGESCDEQCAVCLEGWEGGEAAKEMPCKHRFHGGCIERWLNVNGSCPICRYQMPEEEKDRDERERERRREIWVSFSFGGGRRSGEGDRSVDDGNRS